MICGKYLFQLQGKIDMSLKYWSWWLYPIPQEREGFAAAAFKKTDKAAACGLPVDLHLVISY